MMSEPEGLFSLLPEGPARAVHTVSQVTAMAKRAITAGVPATLRVVGQISNYNAHRSGHNYFTLKDEASELACVMWRSAAVQLKFRPADGLEVIATGEIDVYEKSGRYQLYVRQLEPRGIGALELAFRQLHDKLQREGLFEAARKKPIPAHPRHVAVVTSASGAAIRDILQSIRRRYPCVLVSIMPVAVQGEKAAGEIARALDTLNDNQAVLGIDVIIAGRGGGSLEDLWAFNEEVVARAIARSRISVISGVGHEVDVTISDLVADLRAATPTAAAELAVPDRTALLGDLQQRAHRLSRAAGHRLRVIQERVLSLSRREPLRAPLQLVRQRGQYLDHVQTKLDQRISASLNDRRRLLSRLENVLATIEPRSYLAGVQRRLLQAAHRARLAVQAQLTRRERILNLASNRLTRSSPARRTGVAAERLARLHRTLGVGLAAMLERGGQRLAAADRQLQSVSFRRTLARGYSVTREVATGKLITTAQQVRGGDAVRTETGSGSFDSTVVERAAHEPIVEKPG